MLAVSLWFQALSYFSTNRLMSSSSDCLVCARQIPHTTRKDRTSANLSFITPPKGTLGCTAISGAARNNRSGSNVDRSMQPNREPKYIKDREPSVVFT